jgi:hypothetical protein
MSGEPGQPQTIPTTREELDADPPRSRDSSCVIVSKGPSTGSCDVKTSTAEKYGYRCPVCGDEVTQDPSGKGFVRHKNIPGCQFERGERDPSPRSDALREDRTARFVSDILVPSEDVPLRDIWRFALTYNGYDRHKNVGNLANKCSRRWSVDNSLPPDLATARAALFYEQRRYHHFGSGPSSSEEQYIRALVGHIRDLSDGTVPGPPDPLP